LTREKSTRMSIKSGRDADGLRVNRPTENVVIRNCLTRLGHGMVTFGSDTYGGARNIEVYNIKAYGTNAGLGFKTARTRGRVYADIKVHDIEMVEVPQPFIIELNWYRVTAVRRSRMIERDSVWDRRSRFITIHAKFQIKPIDRFKCGGISGKANTGCELEERDD
jgi:polygalacturonase